MTQQSEIFFMFGPGSSRGIKEARRWRNKDRVIPRPVRFARAGASANRDVRSSY